jgi:rfaE bifunctional protein kinase chain/domain
LKKPFLQIIDTFLSARVAVVGDIMLDHYILGDAVRISPEAPTPVVHFSEEYFVLGGAANTARNVAHLGGKAHLFGVCGDDSAGKKLRELLIEDTILCDGVFSNKKSTTVKTRIVSDGHQMLRLDMEDVLPDTKMSKRIVDEVEKNIKSIDVIIASDYAKGVFTAESAKQLVNLSSKYKKPLVVDAKPKNFPFFKGARVCTPNHVEAASLAEKRCETKREVEEVCRILENKLKSAIVVTRGKEGMCVLDGGTVTHFVSAAREVYDVTGAGDTVIATMGTALAIGASLKDAAYLATVAAGIVVGKTGTASVSLGELKKVLQK